MTNDFVESQSNFNLGKFRLILQLKVVNNIVPMIFLVSFCSLFHFMHDKRLIHIAILFVYYK